MSALARYLARIGLDSPPAASAQGLTAVQSAHRRAIGFENFDILLGRPIRIDAEGVFAKLVERGRGGYCFEHNRLFADMLEQLGFTVRPLLARVWLGMEAEVAAAQVPPRTHTLLLTAIDGAPWIADAGFGASYVPPLPLVDGAEAATDDGARHRLRRVESFWGDWLLERAGPVEATDGRAAAHGDWQPQYGFTLAQVAPVDLEMSNHWTSTRAGTRFTSAGIASVVLADGFAALTDRRLRVYRGGRVEQVEIASAEQFRGILGDLLRIRLELAEVLALGLF